MMAPHYKNGGYKSIAKRLRFPLILRDNYQARTLEELQEYFDLERVADYYQSGKLLSWLEDRGYIAEANQVQDLVNHTADFSEQLCRIFQITPSGSPSITFSDLEDKQKAVNYLKRYTSDEMILNNWKLAVFNQESLSNLLDEGADLIFLCDNEFHIPLSLRGKHYIGFGKVSAILNVHLPVDISDLGIEFTGISLFTPDGQKIPSISLSQVEPLYYSHQFDKAVPLLEELVESGNNRAKCILGLIHIDEQFGVNEKFSSEKGYSLLEDGADCGDPLCKFWQMFCSDEDVKDDNQFLLTSLKASATNNAFTLYSLAIYYSLFEDSDTDRDNDLKLTYLNRSANLGYWRAFRDLGDYYNTEDAAESDQTKAKEYYLKAAHMGDLLSQMDLFYLLYDMDLIKESCLWARKALTPKIVRGAFASFDYADMDIEQEDIDLWREIISATVMQQVLNTLINDIENLPIESKSDHISLTPPQQTAFSTKAAAITAIKTALDIGCETINLLLFTDDTIIKAYREFAKKTLIEAGSYMQICNTNNPITAQEIEALLTQIENTAEQLSDTYRMRSIDSTYPIEDHITDSKITFDSNRYRISYSADEAFGIWYGLDYRANFEKYSQELYHTVKEALYPFKKRIAQITTEVLS